MHFRNRPGFLRWNGRRGISREEQGLVRASREKHGLVGNSRELVGKSEEGGI